jgi:hypothetical protein
VCSGLELRFFVAYSASTAFIRVLQPVGGILEQVDLVLGGPAHWLEKLLEMAPEKKFILEMAQRKVQVLLQVCACLPA